MLVSQTTQPILEFEKVKNFFRKSFSGKQFLGLEIADTICRATSDRQKEVQKISRKCQAVVVVGGKQSANTKNLFELAKKNNKKTFWVDFPEKVKNIKELKKCSLVGILSGASTPAKDIKKTALLVKEIAGKA